MYGTSDRTTHPAFFSRQQCEIFIKRNCLKCKKAGACDIEVEVRGLLVEPGEFDPNNQRTVPIEIWDRMKRRPVPGEDPYIGEHPAEWDCPEREGL